MSISTGLTGKSVLITGAGSGIGRAMANAFAAEGAEVVAADISLATVEETVAKITAGGGKATAVHADVSSRASVDALVQATLDANGRIDVLCNNAGVLDSMGLTENCSDDEWDRVISINLTGAFMLTRAVLPLMTAQGGGALVNTASAAGIRGGCGGTAYTVSKHGVVGLTRSVAFMYREQGIRCNAICPGAINTNIVSGEMSEDGFNRLAPVLMAAGQMAEPEQVASVAVFLASEQASYLSGAIMPVDGGWFAG